jgi:hypothetical protein
MWNRKIGRETTSLDPFLLECKKRGEIVEKEGERKNGSRMERKRFKKRERMREE